MSASFRSILQQVTQEKLEELKVQKNLMTNHFKPALKEAENPSNSPNQTLEILYTAVNTSPVKDTIDNILIENLKYVLQNSKEDPSISSQLVSAWIEKFKQEIQYSLRKCEYSYLYGSLLSEWLELEDRKKSEESKAGLEQTKLDKEKAIAKFQSLMFTQPTPEEFEALKFRKFLSDELFNFGDNVESEKMMQEIKKETEDFFNIEHSSISSYDVQCCIKGLSSEELLSEEKKAALKELSENTEALEEVASLLTNRLRNLQRWEWPSPSCELVDVRRGLAGEYKAFINEDIITALFLQYVGVQWASYFKRQFLRIYNSKMWTKHNASYASIEEQRKQFHQRAFLSSLPDSLEVQESRNQEEYARIEAQMDYCEVLQCSEMMPPSMGMSFGAAAPAPRMMKSKMAKRSVVQPPPPPQKPDIDFKQSFLHVLSSEIRLNQVLRPNNPLIVVQADLESFGPSVIHDAALISLEYLGVPKPWLGFFKRFLQPKIRFNDTDPAKEVLRGVPSSHALSSLFGETLLFLLDFLVNRKCNGMRIYRISDEFWFWSDRTEDVTKAWETMNTYGKMVGLKINENRSGSVSVYSDEQAPKLSENKPAVCGPASLPQRNIHWGYLELHSNGVFKIDQKAITKFLDEMKGLLDKSECVLEWINVFNKYVAFFIRNFGKCSLVTGKQHLDQIISCLKMIYTGLFGSENDGNPIVTLKSRYDKLKEADIVDVWAYWPLERGGLGLVNPFIGIMALRETYVEINDEDGFKKLPSEDKILWEQLKEDHERRYGHILKSHPSSMAANFGGPVPVGPPKMPTFEEYIATRETELSNWYHRYLRLLERPGPKSPSVSDRFWTLDAPMPEDEQDRNYMMWLFTYYETQLVLHFGSVKFINSKLLPMSMIANIQKSKVKH